MEKQKIEIGQTIKARDGMMTDLGEIYFCLITEKISEEKWTATIDVHEPITSGQKAILEYDSDLESWIATFI